MAGLGAMKNLKRREKNGRAQRSASAAQNAMNAKKQADELATGFNNPLRRPFGKDAGHEWLATALGRFCKGQHLRSELWSAGEEYLTIRRSWRAAIDAPVDVHVGEGGGVGDGPSRSTVQKWRKQLDDVERAVKHAHGADAWPVVERLIVDDLDLWPMRFGIATACLRTMAIELGIISARSSAFL